MKDELKVYKEIVEAMKIAESNMQLEIDMRDLNVDKHVLAKKMIDDDEIQKKAQEKVRKQNDI